MNWLLHLIPMFVTYHVYSKGDNFGERKLISKFSLAPNWVVCRGQYVGKFTVFCWLFWSPKLWEKYQAIVDKHMEEQSHQRGLRRKFMEGEE